METKKLNQLAGVQEKVMEKEKEIKYMKNLQQASPSKLAKWQEQQRFRRTDYKFLLKDEVWYRGNNSLIDLIGTIIEIVPIGMYPKTHPRIRGYYKNYITYVILLGKKSIPTRDSYRWCSAKRLSLKVRKLKTSKEQKRN